MYDHVNLPSRSGILKDASVTFINKTDSKAYFRGGAEGRRAEVISARLGSAWHASVLDEENMAVLKQIY